MINELVGVKDTERSSVELFKQRGHGCRSGKPGVDPALDADHQYGVLGELHALRT